MRPRPAAALLAVVLAVHVAPAAAQPLRVEAGETFVSLSPATGFLFVREYYVSTLETDPGRIAEQVADLARRVEGRRYCADRYGFAAFTSVEERMYRERGFLAVECTLRSRERNVRVLGEDAFTRVLNRPVRLTVEEDDVRLWFDGEDVQVRGNNARELLGRGTEQMVVWENGTWSYDAVFGPAGRPKSSFRSLAPYVQRDVHSPEPSPEEMEAWNQDP
jgi:hypothetical protein